MLENKVILFYALKYNLLAKYFVHLRRWQKWWPKTTITYGQRKRKWSWSPKVMFLKILLKDRVWLHGCVVWLNQSPLHEGSLCLRWMRMGQMCLGQLHGRNAVNSGRQHVLPHVSEFLPLRLDVPCTDALARPFALRTAAPPDGHRAFLWCCAQPKQALGKQDVFSFAFLFAYFSNRAK